MTLDRVMEFGGPGLRVALARRARHARQHGHRVLGQGRASSRRTTRRCAGSPRGGPAPTVEALRQQVVAPDPGAQYAGGVHAIDLARDPAHGGHAGRSRRAASPPIRPTARCIADLGEVPIDIAYGGSCTAGKEADLDLYAQVMQEALDAGRRVKDGVDFYHPVRLGRRSRSTRAAQGYLDVFERTGVQVIHPGCGACIGCGPGVSRQRDQVTVSAINRNYQNRSGPGQLYLASPLTVAASAVAGRIVAYREGMFRAVAPAFTRRRQPAREAELERRRPRRTSAPAVRAVGRRRSRARVRPPRRVSVNTMPSGPSPARRERPPRDTTVARPVPSVRTVMMSQVPRPPVAERGQPPEHHRAAVGREVGIGVRAHDVGRARQRRAGGPPEVTASAPGGEEHQICALAGGVDALEDGDGRRSGRARAAARGRRRSG